VPPGKLPAALLAVDLLTPNEIESQMLLGRASGRLNAKQTIVALLGRGPRAVVLKLGGKGAIWAAEDRTFHAARPPKVRVVDTTAAGDAFTAALAVGRTEGMSDAQSLAFANAAGAATCTVRGAQPALPTRAGAETLMKRGAHGVI